MPSEREDPDGRRWLAALYRDELGYVWNTLRRLGVLDADRDDLAQEVFVIAHRRRADFDPARPRRPWLFGIAFRVAAGHRRLARHARELGAADVDGPADAGASGEELMLARERRRKVIAALAELELDQRAVVVMHDLDGFSAPEIAETLGVKLNTVYSRLRLGRERFARALLGLGGAP